MMWFMMRGCKEQPATPEQEQELARLRAQIEVLRPVSAEDAAVSGTCVPEWTPGHQQAVHRTGRYGATRVKAAQIPEIEKIT